MAEDSDLAVSIYPLFLSFSSNKTSCKYLKHIYIYYYIKTLKIIISMLIISVVNTMLLALSDNSITIGNPTKWYHYQAKVKDNERFHRCLDNSYM